MFSSWRKNHPLIKIVNFSLWDLAAPRNLSTFWNYGSLLGLSLIIQIITGFFLSIHYIPCIDLAFRSVCHISRDVNYGWLLRNIHANGASWFFICIYLHVGRGIYYGSYKIIETWNLGIVLLILVIATAFIGYVLPWGQIRFWGATVITNLFSAVPYIGKTLVEWIWGGFAVDNATLNRFFAIHFLLPFIVTAFVVLHLLFLHQRGSNNPLGLNSNLTKVSFHCYYSVKDIFGFVIFFFSLIFLSLYLPNILGDPENFIPANPLVTPVHIKPEWYFLWAYAILRSISRKLGGVVAIFSALLILFFMPILNSSYSKVGFSFYPVNQIIFWISCCNCVILTWIGGRPVEYPYEELGKLFTFFYFLFYLIYDLLGVVWEKNIKYL